MEDLIICKSSCQASYLYCTCCSSCMRCRRPPRGRPRRPGSLPYCALYILRRHRPSNVCHLLQMPLGSRIARAGTGVQSTLETAYIVTRPSLMLHRVAGKVHCLGIAGPHSCQCHGSCLPWGLLTTGRGAAWHCCLQMHRAIFWLYYPR